MARKKSPSNRPPRKDQPPRPSPWMAGLDAAATMGCAILWIGTIASTNDSSTVPGLFDWVGLLWALLGFGLVVLVGWKRVDIVREWSLADTALALWIGWQVVSVAKVFGQGNVRLAMNGLLQSVTMAVIYWCVRWTARRPIDQKWLLAIGLSAVTGLAAAGVYQRHVLQPRDVAAYERDPDAYLGPLAVEYPAGSPQRAHLENRLKSTEPTVMFALTNSFAGLLVTWLMVLIATRTNRPAETPPPKPAEDARTDWWQMVNRYAVPAAIGIALAYTLLLTKSRTALLALLIGAALWGCSQFGKWGLRTAVTIGSIAVGAIVVGSILLALRVWDIQVFSESPKSILYRLEYWYSSSRMIGQNPWFGVGPGNFQSSYALYKLPQASETVADPHNFIVELLATIGLPGGLFALAALVFAIEKCLLSPPAGANRPGESPAVAEQPTFNLWSSLLTLALGFGLAHGATLLAQMTSSNSERLLVVGLPAACLAFVILSPRIAVATDLKIPAVAGVAVLLINLLGAGGWSFPSVAASLWLLLAIGANWSSSIQNSAGDVSNVNAKSTMSLVTAAAMFFSGVWAVAITKLHVIPLASSQVQIAVAQDRLQAGDLLSAEQAAAEAERLDQWSDVPPNMLAQVHWRQFLTSREPLELKRFEEALLRRQSKSPKSASLRAQNGDLFAGAYRETGDPHWLQRATRSYQEAFARYPNSGVLAVQWALAEWVSGNPPFAAQLAEKALVLDRQNPHIEQKLRSQKVAWLFSAVASEPPPELAALVEKGENSAEQIAQYLRSTAATTEPEPPAPSAPLSDGGDVK